MNYVNLIDLSKNILSVSLGCSLTYLLVSKTKFLRSVRYVCGVVMVLSVLSFISPLIESIGNLINIDYSDNEEPMENGTSNQLIINQSASYICEYVKTLISQKYGIDPENISVSVTLNTDNIENVILESVTLSIIKTDEAVFKDIARYISDTLACECIIISNN